MEGHIVWIGASDRGNQDGGSGRINDGEDGVLSIVRLVDAYFWTRGDLVFLL
jgi:hypothetical protein